MAGGWGPKGRLPTGTEYSARAPSGSSWTCLGGQGGGKEGRTEGGYRRLGFTSPRLPESWAPSCKENLLLKFPPRHPGVGSSTEGPPGGRQSSRAWVRPAWLCCRPALSGLWPQVCGLDLRRERCRGLTWQGQSAAPASPGAPREGCRKAKGLKLESCYCGYAWSLQGQAVPHPALSHTLPEGGWGNKTLSSPVLCLPRQSPGPPSHSEHCHSHAADVARDREVAAPRGPDPSETLSSAPPHRTTWQKKPEVQSPGSPVSANPGTGPEWPVAEQVEGARQGVSSSLEGPLPLVGAQAWPLLWC